MPKLVFASHVAEATYFKRFVTDNAFSHFVFQVSNADASDRKTYQLVVFQINKPTPTDPDPEPKLIIPTGWQPVEYEGFNGGIDMGNLILSKAALKKVFENNPYFEYLGFLAVSLGEGKFKKYVKYQVIPTDREGNPKSISEPQFAYSTSLNPSPPARTFEMS